MEHKRKESGWKTIEEGRVPAVRQEDVKNDGVGGESAKTKYAWKSIEKPVTLHANLNLKSNKFKILTYRRLNYHFFFHKTEQRAGRCFLKNFFII